MFCIMNEFVKMSQYSPEIQYASPAHLLTYSCNMSEYIEVDPSVVRLGQVVQLQFAVESVPMSRSLPGTSTFQICAKLRSLCILDRSIQDVSLNHGFLDHKIDNLFAYRNLNYL